MTAPLAIPPARLRLILLRPSLDGLRLDISIGAGGCVMLSRPNGTGGIEHVHAAELHPEQKQAIVNAVAARLGVTR